MIGLRRWALLLHGRRLETVLGTTERVTSVSADCAGQGLANLFHICVPKAVVATGNRAVHAFETDRGLSRVQFLGILQD